MTEKRSVLDSVRQVWEAQGADAAEAEFLARDPADEVSTRWWILGAEIAIARQDLPVFLDRWSRAWASAADHKAVRRSLAELLWTAPWDGELVPLWTAILGERPGKAAWQKQQLEQAMRLDRPVVARLLMAQVGDADNAPDWHGHLRALWRGQGDEAWAAAWLWHLDSRWLIGDAGHSNAPPDAAVFRRLDHWIEDAQAGVIEAWRQQVPPGAWADWLALAAQVARWRVEEGPWPPQLELPASVQTAWPKPLQRQALARLALLAGQPDVARDLGPANLGTALSRPWPARAAMRTAARIELALLHEGGADDLTMMHWYEAKALSTDLRPWWAPHALRECMRQDGAMDRWWQWCEQHGQPSFGPGPSGHEWLVALRQSGRIKPARALLREWAQALEATPSVADQAWLAVSRITLAQLERRPEQAWEALNAWWQSRGLVPLAPASGFSIAELAAAAPVVPAPAASPAAAVTVVMLWPMAGESREGPQGDARAEERAAQSLRSLQRQDAAGLSVLVVTDRALPADLAAASATVPLRTLQVGPDQGMPQRLQSALAAVETPWTLWITPGSVWHPQAVGARLAHLAARPGALASQSLRLALLDSGEVSVHPKRSGLTAGLDGCLVDTALLRELAAQRPPLTDGPQLITRLERRLGAGRMPVWRCTMGLAPLVQDRAGAARRPSEEALAD